jgi:hypothetical protein
MASQFMAAEVQRHGPLAEVSVMIMNMEVNNKQDWQSARAKHTAMSRSKD